MAFKHIVKKIINIDDDIFGDNFFLYNENKENKIEPIIKHFFSYFFFDNYSTKPNFYVITKQIIIYF